jgi:aldose 1-epimerase
LSDLIALNCGNLQLGISPTFGGSICHFYSLDKGVRTDWMRAADEQALAVGSPLNMASFPLVPFSNRIRNGRFDFQGKSVRLPLNFGDHPHTIHGFGWQNPWQVKDQTETGLRLQYNHKADAWPWSWSAQQVFELTGTSLTLDLSVTNNDDSDMPAGLGLHPYFPRDGGAIVTAAVDAMWQVDDEVMPLDLVKPTTPADPSSGMQVNDIALDNGFTGWQGRAEIRWPTRDKALVMSGTGPLDQLVIFTPDKEDFFCVEPVSHGTDAINAGDGPGNMLVLKPGETISASVRFEIV